MEINTIHNTNFLNNNLEDKSVKLIIADPPYFEVKGGFDFIWKTFEDYQKDVEIWAKECKRLLADNGTLLWYGHAKKIAYSQIIFDKYFNLENSLIWEKIECQTKRQDFEQSRCFAPVTERILMYSNEIEMTGLQAIYSDAELFITIKNYLIKEKEKSKLTLTYLNEILKGVRKSDLIAKRYFGNSQWQLPIKQHYEKLKTTGFFQKPYETLRQEYETLRQEYETLRQEYEVLRRPFNNLYKNTDVLKYSQEANISKNYNHPTQKPEKLTRMLIQTCSNEGDLVFVPFAGSGTECAMSVKEKRNFIGYEIDKTYCDLANKRVLEIKNNLTIF
jgi:site-specific DNA-methyltransferase (adenine-specific)